jgi:hypothetical protein
MMALSTQQRELSADTETRVAALTELIATAISNRPPQRPLNGRR